MGMNNVQCDILLICASKEAKKIDDPDPQHQSQVF